MSSENKEVYTEHLWEDGFKISTSFRYMGGFPGTNDDAENYTLKKVEIWINSMDILFNISVRPPQAFFSGIIHLLQHEWEYIQGRVPSRLNSPPLYCALSKSFTPSTFGVVKVQD